MRSRGPLRFLLVVLALLAPALAGCVAPGVDPVAPAATRTALPGEGIDTGVLTKPVHGILPKIVEYVPVTVDGILLYAEVHLPDEEGPWPTILEMSPYNVFRANGELDEFRGAYPSLVEYYVPRGYAVVLAHVRGTGNSEGCMNMMGAKEQQDAHDLVEWVAQQPWSDGKVGMHGASYVGTTPHEALITAPEPLVTVVTVAGVTNQWRNVYQNGVPYEGRHYPLTYEAMVGAPPPTDVERGPAWALNAASGACEQEEAIEAMSPGVYEKGLYTDYWAERNFTAHAANAKASIFYNQGFADRAVNPMEALHWFNELPVPKKAFLHQEGHRYPPRDDYKTTEHAWFDHWLKGIDNGVMDTPTVEVLTNVDTIRVDTEWPPRNASRMRLHLSPDGLTADAPADGAETYRADLARNPASVGPDPLPSGLAWTTSPLEEDVHLAGAPWMHLSASVNAENTYFLFDLYDVHGDTWTRLTEGWFNAHLREGFDQSAPLTPGETATFGFKFEPHEYVFQKGHRIGLRVHGHDDRVFPVDELVTENTVHYGPEGSWVELPVLEAPLAFERPDGV